RRHALDAEVALLVGPELDARIRVAEALEAEPPDISLGGRPRAAALVHRAPDAPLDAAHRRRDVGAHDPEVEPALGHVERQGRPGEPGAVEEQPIAIGADVLEADRAVG